MNVLVLKQRFYKYINRAEYTMALTTLIGTLGTTIFNSYSTYLDDKNKRIERINKKPLNYIYVDIISEETYEKMIDKRNWKPVSEREKLEEQQRLEEERQKTLEHKKTKVIEMINGWLANKTKKQKASKDEIDEETLKNLKINRNFFTENGSISLNGEETKTNASNDNANTDNSSEDAKISSQNEENTDKNKEEKKNKENIKAQYQNVYSPSKLGSLFHKDTKNILPPMKKEKEKPRYFVVKECTYCKQNRVLDYRLYGKKQNISAMESEKEVAGLIGRQEIKKDSSIFDSLGRIWRAILHMKEDDKQRIIDSRYDQYGNRTAEYKSFLQQRRASKKARMEEAKKRKNDKYEVIGYEFEDEDNNEENTNSEEKVEAIVNVKGEEKHKKRSYATPHFVLEGNLQEMAKYSKFADIASTANSSVNDLQMLAYLEYALEHCWHNFSKKYTDHDLSATYVVEYNENSSVRNIQYVNSNGTDDDAEILEDLKQDAVFAIQNCDISRVKFLSKNNYDLWKKVKITFSGANTN